MITIRFYKKKESLHMHVRGHAGAGRRGEDLVCAGASMIAYTLAQALEFFWLDGKLKRKPKLKLREGRCDLVATPKDEWYADVMMAYWVQQCGAHVLARNYPKNVHLDHIRIADTVSLA